MKLARFYFAYALFFSVTGFSQVVEPTYHRDILPIIHNHCVVCHREGDVAPFPLDDYKQVRKKARMIMHVIEDGYMPPWKPKRGIGEFVGEKRLSPAEIATLNAWVTSEDRPEGNPLDVPKLTTLPKAGTWRLGEPDLVLTMEEPFVVPADGPDIYRYFVLPQPKALKKDSGIGGH